MESNTAIQAFAALAHPQRLEIIRRLVRAGRAGLAAGDISAALEVQPSTASNNLSVLANAGLIRAERQGRTIRYFAAYDALGGVITYLMEECCEGQLSACWPEISNPKDMKDPT
ncbi:MAG: ArsR/SmtB family transcription factor [Maritimibacter sp.]